MNYLLFVPMIFMISQIERVLLMIGVEATIAYNALIFGLSVAPSILLLTEILVLCHVLAYFDYNGI